MNGKGQCASPSSCAGTTYSGYCPGTLKCCVPPAGDAPAPAPAPAAATASKNRLIHRGKPIFLSGINVAWGPAPAFCSDILYLNPGCKTQQCVSERNFFEQMLQEVSSAGGNSVRFWLLGDGSILPVNNYKSRLVTRIPAAQIASVNWLLDMGTKYNIVFILCLWSFDMVNDQGYGAAYGMWNTIVTDPGHTDSFISNWLMPFTNAVKDHPALLALEVFNEPEGMMVENWGWTLCPSGKPECARITINQAQRFANRVASAIHSASASLKVTVGSWSYIANSIVNGNWNLWSDKQLVAAGGKPDGTLDFYQVHYYNWAYPQNSPFVHRADEWGASDKPHVIGEMPNNPTGVNSAEIYKTLYTNGYAGALGWVYYNAQRDPAFDKQVFLDNMRSMQAAYGAYGWPTSAAPKATAPKACTNSYPYNDGYSCDQQAGWGKCSQPFMKSPVCDRSCGRC